MVSNVPIRDLHMFTSRPQWMASKREALSCRPELDGEFRGGVPMANGETRAVVSKFMHILSSLAIANSVGVFC